MLSSECRAEHHTTDTAISRAAAHAVNRLYAVGLLEHLAHSRKPLQAVCLLSPSILVLLWTVLLPLQVSRTTQENLDAVCCRYPITRHGAVADRRLGWWRRRFSPHQHSPPHTCTCIVQSPTKVRTGSCRRIWAFLADAEDEAVAGSLQHASDNNSRKVAAGRDRYLVYTG